MRSICPINWPEPFGLVFVEALACGTPVITRPFGAAPEIVTSDVGCPLRRRQGHGRRQSTSCRAISPHVCRARAVDHFSGDAMVRGYMRVYESVLADAVTTRRATA